MISFHSIKFFQRDIAQPAKQKESSFCFFKKMIPLTVGAFILSKRSGNHYIPLKAPLSEDNFTHLRNAAKDQSAHRLTPLDQNIALKNFFRKEDKYLADPDQEFDSFVKDRFQLDNFINERFPLQKVDNFEKTPIPKEIELTHKSPVRHVEIPDQEFDSFVEDRFQLDNFINERFPPQKVDNFEKTPIRKDIELTHINTHKSPIHHVKIVVTSTFNYSDPSIEESKKRVINTEKLALETLKLNLTRLLKPSVTKKGKIRAQAIKKTDIAKIFGIRMGVVAADNFPDNLRFEDIYKEVWQNDHTIFPRLLRMNSDNKENAKTEWGALNYAIQKYGLSGSFENNDAAPFLGRF